MYTTPLIKDVLILGAGIAGCALALALVKRGISVTLATCPSDQRVYHGSFVKDEFLQNDVARLPELIDVEQSSSRSVELLVKLAKKSIQELLAENYTVDRNGNVDIYRCLQQQLAGFSQVEWLPSHVLVDLITLESDSTRVADRYKKPACFGAWLYQQDTGELEPILAKEVVLATGSLASLYPYSTHDLHARGEGLGIAMRRGVRTLSLTPKWVPLALFEENRPLFPLPAEWLLEGGRLLISKNGGVCAVEGRPEKVLFQQMLSCRQPHLWLDLTMADISALKERFFVEDHYCLSRGFNLAKELLPVAPAVGDCMGGIVVDGVGQSSMQRLRALGAVAETGLRFLSQELGMQVLQSVTWAVSAAEDIVKQLPKLIYSFPDFVPKRSIEKSPNLLEEKWQLLGQILWLYAGIESDPARKAQARALLRPLEEITDTPSIAQLQFQNAFQAACKLVS